MNLTSHAYLFIGPEQIGKKKFARESFPDSQDVKLVVEHGIDAVREAKAFLSLRSFTGGRRVVIIDDAHALTEEAQNALLKVLEEPSPSGLLILVTAHPEALLETIRSRCEVREFHAATRPEFADALREQNINQKQVEFLYDFTGGAIGLAKNLLADTDAIKRSASELNAFVHMNLRERFEKTKELSMRATIQTDVLYWMRHAYAQKHVRLLRPLLDLYTVLSQPQFNKQLALERWMIEI